MQAAPQTAPLIGDMFAKAQEWPLAEEIGERLELLLPEPIRRAKALKEGKQLPPDLAPSQPTPEQAAAVQMDMAAKAADTRGKEADARKKEADAQRAQIELERTLMMPVAGQQPDVGAALEGMARAIVDLQTMVGGIIQASRRPPEEPPPPMPVEPAPPDMPPDGMPGMAQPTPDQPPPSGGFFVAEPQGEQPQF